MLRLSETHDQITVVDDQIGSPPSSPTSNCKASTIPVTLVSIVFPTVEDMPTNSITTIIATRTRILQKKAFIFLSFQGLFILTYHLLQKKLKIP